MHRSIRLRDNRDFRLLLLGQAVSLLGDAVFDTTALLWVATSIAAGQSWAPLAVGAVLASGVLATVAVAPVAGVYSDRRDWRQVMLATDGIRAVLVAGLAVAPFAWSALTPLARLCVVCGTVALSSAATQFFNPARFALFGAIVLDQHRERATGLAQTLGSLAGIVGPPIAAPLLISLGAQWGMLLDSVSFLLSFLAISRVRSTPGAARTARTGSMRREFLSGLRFFAGSPRLRVLLVTLSMVTMGGAAVNALNVFFVRDNLNAPVRLYGLLETALGAGAVLGALLVAALGPRVTATRVYGYGTVLTGLLLVGYSRAVSFPIALLLLFLTGIPAAALSAMIGPLVLRCAPAEYTGRVVAILGPANQVAGMLSVLLATWLATVLPAFHTTVAGVRFSVLDTVMLVGGLLVAASGAWAAWALRSGR